MSFPLLSSPHDLVLLWSHSTFTFYHSIAVIEYCKYLFIPRFPYSCNLFQRRCIFYLPLYHSPYPLCLMHSRYDIKLWVNHRDTGLSESQGIIHKQPPKTEQLFMRLNAPSHCNCSSRGRMTGWQRCNYPLSALSLILTTTINNNCFWHWFIIYQTLCWVLHTHYHNEFCFQSGTIILMSRMPIATNLTDYRARTETLLCPDFKTLS